MTTGDFFFYSRNPVSEEQLKFTFDSYDEMVKAKRQRNADMLNSSGLLQAAEALKVVTAQNTKKKSASQRGIAKRKSTRAELPPRKSSRLRGIAADGNFVEHERGGRIVAAFETVEVNKNAADTKLNESDRGSQEYFHGRVNDGSALSIKQAIDLLDPKWRNNVDDQVKSSEIFMKQLKQHDVQHECSTKSVKGPTSTAIPSNNFIDDVKALRIDSEDNVAKVTPERIYAITCHPSKNIDAFIACAGDKRGNLGLWNVNSANENDGVHLYKPHSSPITHLEWNSTGSSLYSISYDGSVREFDVNSEAFTQVFATYDESESYKNEPGFGIHEGHRFWTQHGILDHRNDSCMFLSTSVGSVFHIDMRMGKGRSGLTFNQTGLSEKKINTVDLHRNGYTLATCGLDNSIKLWDVRKFGSQRAPKPIARRVCGKSVSSAFFSPSGDAMLSTTMANTIEIVKQPHLASGTVKTLKQIKHNNQTGRWLSTFMARWHPSEDIFVVGCLKQPRQVEIFNNDGTLISGIGGESLTAVASRCCFHPRSDTPIVVGGNSSGRVSILRPS